MYRTFTRTWWRNNPEKRGGKLLWPNGLEPCPGPKHYCTSRIKTEEEARAQCKQYNSTHEPGRLSLKMEYEET